MVAAVMVAVVKAAEGLVTVAVVMVAAVMVAVVTAVVGLVMVAVVMAAVVTVAVVTVAVGSATAAVATVAAVTAAVVTVAAGVPDWVAVMSKEEAEMMKKAETQWRMTSLLPASQQLRSQRAPVSTSSPATRCPSLLLATQSNKRL